MFNTHSFCQSAFSSLTLVRQGLYLDYLHTYLLEKGPLEIIDAGCNVPDGLPVVWSCQSTEGIYA